MDHIRKYFNALAESLQIKSILAGTCTHKPDIGSNRENIVNDFLNKHLPSSLKSVLGGQILGFDGRLSGQIDIIIVNDISIRFDENEKTFVTSEGVAGAISVKSHLDKNAIQDCLTNLASIPDLSKDVISFRFLRPGVIDEFIKHHPSRFVFAFTGIDPQDIKRYVEDFYINNTIIPEYRYPRGIIVNKNYMLTYHPNGSTTIDGTEIPPKSWNLAIITEDFKGHSLLFILDKITNYLDWIPYMRINFYKYINKPFENLLSD